jgi:hypothetical protein
MALLVYQLLYKKLTFMQKFHCISQCITGCPTYESATEFIDVTLIDLFYNY